MTAITSAYCHVHGYGAPHVETTHGLRCLKCINQRRAQSKYTETPELTYVEYPAPRFELRIPYAMEDLRKRAARSGFHWEPVYRAWTILGALVSRVEEFYTYATPYAREIIDAWRAKQAARQEEVNSIVRR